MVSDLNRSKNFSKMKSQKSNSRSRRNKLSLTKDQGTKSPKMEQQSRENKKDTTNIKIKSGSWKRTTCHWDLPCNPILKPNDTNDDLIFPSLPVKSQPRILYSDVLFSGEKLKTPVKIKNLTPRHSVKINSSRSRKRLISVERMPSQNKSKENCNAKITCWKSAEIAENNTVPKSSGDLEKCINNLFKSLNINIPTWNFEDYGQFSDNSEFVCRFDDYNYLVCENVALAGLRLASDGKFKS